MLTFEHTFFIELSILTLGYWGIDYAIRQNGFVILWKKLFTEKRFLQKFAFHSSRGAIYFWTLGSAFLSLFTRWPSLPEGDTVRILALILVGILVWQATTKDIDPVKEESLGLLRIVLLASWVGLFFSPFFLLTCVFLLTTPFGIWQHHATLPMRLLQAMTAFVTLHFGFHGFELSSLGSGLGLIPSHLFESLPVLIFFLLSVQISHYLITALAKCFLGPKWYSWVTDNRLHHIAASAYSWGWARFIPWDKWKQVIFVTKKIEKPLQLMAFTIELLSPLALLHPYLAISLCIAWAGFHFGVFCLSGLLFWDWILTDLAIVFFITQLPDSVTLQSFGLWPCLVSLAFLALFPLRHKLWKPMPLGWFDTPFTQRIHWRVKGESGQEYGLYNNFMCPHERLYGKVNACFFAPVPVITYHLGEVWKPQLREAIYSAGPNLEALDKVRVQFGISPKCVHRSKRHQNYLHRFFYELNLGKQKYVLPKMLRWLKAPGDQLFYWGEIQSFRLQEKVTEVSLVYREEYFDGKELLRLREETVLQFNIDMDNPPLAETEPSPKEIDDFLLGHAAGRLIDLPGFNGGYVQGDDGKKAILA